MNKISIILCLATWMYLSGASNSLYNCYTCSYHVKKKENMTAGYPNCEDPFNASGIPTHPCQGSCAVIYHEISTEEFFWTRTCVPNCENETQDNNYVHCCEWNLCNSSSQGCTGTQPNAQGILMMLCFTGMLLLK